MTDTPTTTAPADIGAATAAILPALSQEAAATEIRVLRAGGDAAWREAYLGGAMHPGHEAALMRMNHLQRLAAGEAADTAAPASATPGRDAATGRFASEADQVDATPYTALRLETMPADTPLEDLARVTTDIQFMAASTGVPADLAKSGVQMIERDIAARQGRAMDAGELATFETALLKRVGKEGYDKACDAMERAFKRAGSRGDAMRRSLLSSSPETAAWIVSTMHYEGRARV